MLSRRLSLLLVLAALVSGCNIKVYTVGAGSVSADAPVCHQATTCFEASRGSILTLTATPAAEARFVRWNGACAGQTGNTCVLSVRGDASVQALFEQDPAKIPYGGESTLKPVMQPGSPMFFDAPWPNDLYSRTAEGTIATAGMPLPSSGVLVSQVRAMAARTQGFSTHNAAYFQLNIADTFWQSFTYRGAVSYYGYIHGAYINIDRRSASFGRVIPAVASAHAPYDTPNRPMPPHEYHLAMLQPADGHTLEPGTQYAAYLMTDAPIPLQQADLMARLATPWTADTGMSRAVFDGLRDQQQRLSDALAIAGSRLDDVAAFTAFTTGHPKAIDQAVGKAIAEITDADILRNSSVSSMTDTSRCASAGIEEATVQTMGPDFVTGSGLHLFGGGNIEIQQGKATVQSQQPLTLKVYFPCSMPAADERRALIAHASGTGGTNAYMDFHARDAVSVVLTAPEAGERVSDATLQLQKLLRLLGPAASIDTNLLVDFNLFNVDAAVSQHVQYGADLHYALRVGRLLPALFVQAGLDPARVMTDPALATVSGVSLGGIATLHALAQGAPASIMTSISAPRPSVDYIDDLMLWLQGYDSTAASVVSKYSGLQLNLPTAPLQQLLQIVIDPMDTLNYLDELDHRAYALSVGDYSSDPLHGGRAAWSLLKEIPRRQSVMLISGGGDEDLALGIPDIRYPWAPLDNLQNGPLKILTTGGYWRERSSDIVPALCLPAVMGRANVSLTEAMRPERTVGCL